MLRHRVDVNDLGNVDRSQEVRNVIPKSKPPVEVRFLRDSNPAKVVSQITSAPYVSLQAAVGAGKSVRVPAQLAAASGKLVVHTVPFHVAAKEVYGYVSSHKPPCSVVYMDDNDMEWPKSGLVITTNARLLSRLYAGKLSAANGSILYLDEVHESDCWTEVVRTIAPSLKVFTSVVLASATAAPGVRLEPITAGVRVLDKYSPRDTADWSAFDEDVPWCSDRLTGNTVLCVERPDVRERLMRQYEDVGFVAHELTARSTHEQYRRVIDQMAHDKTIHVLLVDYAYRSSFTFPDVELVVDACEVLCPAVEDGTIVNYYRDAFDFEKQQFQGRAGRIPGKKVVASAPDLPLEHRMCDLEAMEVHAAALLYRMAGYRPPMRFNDSKFYEGKVPDDLAGALMSDDPVLLYPDDSLVPWITPGFTKHVDPGPARHEYKRRRFASVMTVPETPGIPKDLPPLPGGARRGSVGTVQTLDSEASESSERFGQELQSVSVDHDKTAIQRVDGRRDVGTSVDVGSVSSGIGTRSLTVRKRETEAAALRTLEHVGEVRKKQSQATIDQDCYLYAHDMMRAPRFCSMFPRGYASIEARFERGDVASIVGDAKLYMLYILIERHNTAMAKVNGLNRLWQEFSTRKINLSDRLINKDAPMKTMQSWQVELAEATGVVEQARAMLFSIPDPMLSEIPYPAELEVKHMFEYERQFTDSMRVHNEDEMRKYLSALNNRSIS